MKRLKRIFIDGSAGTTGLRIYDRLSQRGDIELIKLPEELRKDPGARREALNDCDIAFLCLPDEAAREAVSMVESGLGISILPELILKRIPYRIVARELEIPAYRNIGLAWKEKKGNSPMLKRFLEYLDYR